MASAQNKPQQRIKSVASLNVAAVGGQEECKWTGEIPEHEINFIFDQSDLQKMAMQAHGLSSSQSEMSSKTTSATSSLNKQIGQKKASAKSSINLIFDGNDLNKETIKSRTYHFPMVSKKLGCYKSPTENWRTR